ncbi:MAG TPA: succinate dehydrogenase, cytochrome b556 subunit [Anaerolineaceae bacterium]|nr:succinate dehydrogenase, cytochrome b556 subunit [Anaerolineaceae bacterium]
MSTFRTTLAGYTRYRGREGQWMFILHRLTGLGTLLFLTIHILDTATVYFIPSLYDDAIGLYRTTLFGIGELALVFSVIFHGVNGLRLAFFDMFFPKNWTIPTERTSALWTLGISLVLFLPAAVIMLRNLLIHNFGLFGG